MTTEKTLEGKSNIDSVHIDNIEKRWRLELKSRQSVE